MVSGGKRILIGFLLFSVGWYLCTLDYIGSAPPSIPASSSITTSQPEPTPTPEPTPEPTPTPSTSNSSSSESNQHLIFGMTPEDITCIAGLITAIAGLITAISGFILVLKPIAFKLIELSKSRVDNVQESTK